jgi:hypothetical protein
MNSAIFPQADLLSNDNGPAWIQQSWILKRRQGKWNGYFQTVTMVRFELTTSVVIGTDCICSCKSNYHTITATMAFSFSICLLLTIHYIWTFFILDISKYSGCFKCVQRLSVTCDRSVVFSESSGFLHQLSWPPRYIAECDRLSSCCLVVLWRWACMSAAGCPWADILYDNISSLFPISC